MKETNYYSSSFKNPAVSHLIYDGMTLKDTINDLFEWNILPIKIDGQKYYCILKNKDNVNSGIEYAFLIDKETSYKRISIAKGDFLTGVSDRIIYYSPTEIFDSFPNEVFALPDLSEFTEIPTYIEP